MLEQEPDQADAERRDDHRDQEGTPADVQAQVK